MKFLRRSLLLVLVGLAGTWPMAGQPTLIQPNRNQPVFGSGINNLRVASQSPDGTEVSLAMDYTYDGFGGQTALIFPVIDKKDQKGVSGWFGADPVTVVVGKGQISIKVKYFNDEAGVPPQFTSDRIRMLFVNNSRSAIITQSIVLKTINWGSADAKPILNQKAAQPPADKVTAEQQARTAGDAEAKAREQARVAGEAEATARTEAESREQARIAAETESKRLTEARIKAEAEAKRLTDLKSEAEADKKARQAALADAKRLTDEKVKSDERIRIEAEASRLAEEKLRAQASVRLKAENEAKTQQKVRIEAEQQAQAATAVPGFQMAANLKSKVSNVDVVNRSVDRTQMTIGVEFDLKDDFSSKPVIGIDVTRRTEPKASQYFSTPKSDASKGKRGVALFAVKYQPPNSNPDTFETYPTDSVVVYVQDGQQRLNLFPAPLTLVWRAPGAGPVLPIVEQTAKLEYDKFKQNTLYSGYVTVKYTLPAAGGKVIVRVLDAKTPRSVDWFQIDEVSLKGGSGLQLVKIDVKADAQSPGDVIKADTIEVQLVDSDGNLVGYLKEFTPMTWARPK